jgi:hypothetical protein
LSISIPFSSLPSLKSLQLTAAEMPHSSWQELSNINAAAAAKQAAAETEAALTTGHAVNQTQLLSSSSSTASNRGLTELVLSNSSVSLQEMTVVNLQGLRRLQLVDWRGTAGELSAALASSSNTLTELALHSCKIGFNGSSTAEAAPRYQGQAVAAPQVPVQAAAEAVAMPVCKFAAMLANLPRLGSLELRESLFFKFVPGIPVTSDAPSVTIQATPPVPLLDLRRLDIGFLGDDALPTALLHFVSPCTLTRLDLSAAHASSYIRDTPAMLRQLPRLQQLQHCKLGYNSEAWQPAASSAEQMAAVRGLSSLTYLCLERGYLTAKELARHLYCKAGVLPQLRVLEIHRVVNWTKPSYTAFVTMGPQYGPGLDPGNAKYEAEVGPVRQKPRKTQLLAIA